MSSKTDYTPTVKAYEYGTTIVVKYYDNGEANTLSCPLCHWFGALEMGHADNALADPCSSEFRCPDCNTKLASVSLSAKV